jgi:hypothetical protein
MKGTRTAIGSGVMAAEIVITAPESREGERPVNRGEVEQRKAATFSFASGKARECRPAPGIFGLRQTLMSEFDPPPTKASARLSIAVFTSSDLDTTDDLASVLSYC